MTLVQYIAYKCINYLTRLAQIVLEKLNPFMRMWSTAIPF